MIDKSSFGERLKAARRNAGITQRELASLINAKHNSISNWENGQNMPGSDIIVNISKALNVPVGFLIGHDHSESVVPALPPEAVAFAQDYSRLDEEHKRLARGFMALLKDHMH